MMSSRNDVKTVLAIAKMFQLIPIKDIKEYDFLIADFTEKVELEEGRKEVTHGVILLNGDVLLLCKANGWADPDGWQYWHSVNKRNHETGKWEIIDRYYPEEFEPVPEMDSSDGLFGKFLTWTGSF